MVFLTPWRCRERCPRCHRIAGFARVVTLAILLGLVTPLSAEADVEYRVKAAMLFNFAHFIQWPEAPRERLLLCVIGDYPAAALDEIDATQAAGWTLEVRRDPAPAALDQCHILFTPAPSQPDHAVTLQRLASLPVVTVSDASGFTDVGGMVEFVLVDGKVRFDINLGAARRAGLLFSSKLLRLARRVVGGT